MDDYVDKLILVLLGLVIFFALIGVIISQSNTVNWAALNVGGQTVNLSFAPYVIILVVVIATIIIVYRYMLKHRK